MELQAVACANCGAPLAVPGEARFVTCNHCDCTLEIKHTESVTYSEKMAQIDVRTERIEAKLDVMRLEGDLEACEQEWNREKLNFTSVNEKGEKIAPTVAGHLWTAGVIVVFGLVLIGRSGVGPAAFLGWGVGLVLVACCICLIGLGSVKLYEEAVSHYDEAEKHYLGRRFRLVSQLKQARKASSCEMNLTTNE